eukprot:COSAG06_NODE_11131_length_1562_cov_0.914559_1_plen_80_part_10
MQSLLTTLLYSTLLYSTLLYSTLLYSTLLYSTHRPAATSSSLAALKRDGSHIASCSEVKQITSTFVRTCTAYATAGIITS